VGRLRHSGQPGLPRVSQFVPRHRRHRVASGPNFRAWKPLPRHRISPCNLHASPLEVVAPEAEVVRRIWRDAAAKSTGDIARDLQRDGVQRHTTDPWTLDAVKDIIRRGRFYLGFVTYRRGAEERPGRHPAIINEQQWSDGRKATDARRSGRSRRSSKKRVYLLAGLGRCVCGALLHGQTRSARGSEWRYYLCRHCGSPSVPAQVAEAAVMAAVTELILPPAVVERARAELRRRLSMPSRGAADERRARAQKRIVRLGQMFEWGDIEEAEYRRKVEEAKTDLAALPESDKVAGFDDVARMVSSLPAALAIATPGQVKDLVRLVVESVETRDHQVSSVAIVPAARPFFADDDLLMAPPDGLEHPIPTQRPGLVSRGRVRRGSPTRSSRRHVLVGARGLERARTT